MSPTPTVIIHLTAALGALVTGPFVLWARLGQRLRPGLHRKTMQSLYLGACVGAGIFTLLPNRYLGQLVWHHWLGWL